MPQPQPRIVAIIPTNEVAPVIIGIDSDGQLWQFVGFTQPSGQVNTVTWQGPMNQVFMTPLPINP